MTDVTMPLVVEWVLALMLVVAGLAALIGAIGLWRLPGVLSRLHAPGVTSTLGIGGVSIAAAIGPWLAGGAIGWYALLIFAFVFVTAPVSTHWMALVMLRHRGWLSGVPKRPPSTDPLPPVPPLPPVDWLSGRESADEGHNADGVLTRSSGAGSRADGKGIG